MATEDKAADAGHGAEASSSGMPQLDFSTWDNQIFWIFIALLSIQIVYGAFMAGTRAGFMYATWPDMNGALVPAAFGSMHPIWHDLVSNPDSINFIRQNLTLSEEGSAGETFMKLMGDYISEGRDYYRPLDL